MNDGDAPRVFYLALLIVMVASSLIGTRLPFTKMVKMALAWVAVFGGFFILFSFRGEFVSLSQRLRAEATGTPLHDGAEVRIPMSDDGHFWIEAEVNGTSARFLVDSGASVTTIAETVAKAAKVDGSNGGYISTANGPARVSNGTVRRLQVASIERADFPVLINRNDDTNVLGMNFLSSLDSWRVERNYLVMVP